MGCLRPNCSSCLLSLYSPACLKASGQNVSSKPALFNKTLVAPLTEPISCSTLALPVGSSPAEAVNSKSRARHQLLKRADTNSLARSVLILYTGTCKALSLVYTVLMASMTCVSFLLTNGIANVRFDTVTCWRSATLVLKFASPAASSVTTTSTSDSTEPSSPYTSRSPE